MRATAPAFGLLRIPLRRFFRKLGLDYVEPPPIGPESRERGVALSPEQICLPFKLNVANYLDCIKAGADTIFIAGGRGPCRFGLYGTLQGPIVKRVAPAVDFVVVNQDNLLELVDRVDGVSPVHPGRLAMLKWIGEGFRVLRAAEENLERAYATAAAAARPAEVWDLSRRNERALAHLDDPKRLPDLRRRIREGYAGVARARTPDLRIGIVGEIYLLIEPQSNMDLRRRLAGFGARTETAIHISEWLLKLVKLDLFARLPAWRARRIARPYLTREVGGKALHTVAATVDYARRGFDGVIHLTPFGCMPELVAQAALQRVAADFKFPILYLNFDEHAADTGLATRVEAFIDLLRMKRSSRGA